MGKSPGKWIKTILLGKKSSRSNTSKAKYVSKPTNEQDTLVAAKEPTADLPVNPPLVSEPTPDMADRDEGNSVAEKGISSGIDCDEGSILSGNQDVDKQETLLLGAANDLERAKLEQAATKVQATFRGYLARRAFWVLRGIIRLQALVRGHLVRRQAVATLRCMQGIIKFQALVRGRRVKIYDAAIEGTKKSSVRRPTDAKGPGSYEDNSSTRTVKLSSNAFVRKLLRSSPTGMPLRLQYSPEEPNSAYIWLERWTRSRFWEPIRLAKKTVDQKSHSKQGTLQNVETKPSRSRRTVRKSPVAHAENGLVHSNPDSEKPRRNFRKISVPPVDHVQEHPQSELEKVKRNLRKVSNLIIEPTDQVEVETEKPKNSVEVLNSPATNVTENGTYSSVEKTKEDASVAVPLAVSEERVVETTAKQLVSDEPIAVLHDDHPPPEVPPLENIGQSNGNIVTDEDVILKDDKSNHDNQRASKRRASFPAKQETPENGLQNSPKLPSYMLATESAKAKLRGQGSPRSGQDASEKNGSTRRYSLPSSTGAKLSSLSPRTQRPVQANGKATKSEKSLLASKDGNDKAIQAEWRR